MFEGFCALENCTYKYVRIYIYIDIHSGLAPFPIIVANEGPMKVCSFSRDPLLKMSKPRWFLITGPGASSINIYTICIYMYMCICIYVYKYIYIYIYMLAPRPIFWLLGRCSCVRALFSMLMWRSYKNSEDILTPWQMFMCQSIVFHVDHHLTSSVHIIPFSF